MLRTIKNQKGQGLVEYLIIVAIMAIGTMGIMRVMNNTVQAKFARITNVLQGSKANVQIRGETLTEEHVKKRDMGNFFHGASSKTADTDDGN